MALASLPERFNSPVSSFIFANRAQTRTLKVGRSFATYAQDDEDVAAAAVDESTEPADAFAEDASAKDDVPAAEDAPEEGAAAAFAATPVKNNRRVDQGTYNVSLTHACAVADIVAADGAEALKLSSGLLFGCQY